MSKSSHQPTNLILSQSAAQKDKDARQKEKVQGANSEMKKKSHIEKVLYTW